MYELVREQRKPDAAARPEPVRRRRPVVQAKLTVGAAHDPLEREADRVADQVMAILRHSERAEPADSPLLDGPSRISRHAGHGHDHDHAGGAEVGMAGGAISSDLSSRIQSASGGVPLDVTSRERMERGFGADFSAVRIHAGSPLPRQISADAFTVGSRIHFAPGSYEPSSSAGQRLLAHELTHVVQQGSATAHRHTLDCVHGHDHPTDHGAVADDITLADTGWAVRRHSSWEHMLIGDLDPDSLSKLGAAYDIAGSDQPVTVGHQVNGAAINVTKAEVQHVIQQEISRLKKFQSKPPMVTSFTKLGEIEAYQKQKDPTWDVTLVGVPNDSGKTFMVTYGELNTLGDFFGSVEEMKAMDPVWVEKLIRGVRQSTMRELITVYAEVTGLRDELNEYGDDIITKEDQAKDELGIRSDTFKSSGGSSNAVELGGVLNELRLMGAVPTFFAKPTVGGDAKTDYASTLARNACHFAPESWHAWAGYHEKAKGWADRAYKMAESASQRIQDIQQADYTDEPERRAKDVEAAERTVEAAWELRNEALLNNGFGDHYLQDSYAAGHLINKTRIMQMYVKWLDKNPGKWDAHRDKNWRKLQQIAYNQPGLTDPGQYNKAGVGAARNTSSGKAIETGRNPQTVENIKGNWKDKAEALGLQAPSSLSDPDAKKLMYAWQTLCVEQFRIRNPRVQTVKEIIKLGKKHGLNEQQVWAALDHLFKDGIVRKESYKASDLTKQHELGNSDKLTIRDEYVPSGRASLDRITSKPGAMEDMALGVAYNDYLEFMNSSFLQKATNFLHDHWCKNGLEVQGDDGAPVFKVYGDDSMFKQGASMGLKHSGETAHMSRDSIIEIADTGHEPPTHTTQAI
ncbi:MAG: DUF4157 domain-containing protein, partial [Ilumatobacteraceae bacterium]